MAPTDEELLELMPQGFRDDLALVSRMASHGAGPEVQPGLFRVTLNTGALDYARAVWDRARAALAQPEPGGRPAPAPAGEVCKEEIDCETCGGSGTIDETLGGYGDSNPAATCPDCDGIGVIAVLAPALAGEVAELVAWLRDHAMDCKELGRPDWAERCRTSSDLLERQAAPVPVAVSERPWEREGWCDEQGQCWVGDPGGGGFIPSWRLCRPEDAPNMKVSLPANALPLPSGEVQP